MPALEPEPAPVLTDRDLARLVADAVGVVEVDMREGLLAGVVELEDLFGLTEGRRAAPALGVAAFEGVDMMGEIRAE